MDTHLVFIVYKHHCLFSNIGILKNLGIIDYHNKKLIDGKMNSYEGLCKKCTHPYNHMLTVVETSFSCPKNVEFFNSKLGQAVDVNRTIN